MNLNIKAEDQHSYDAIVIGSGISGGWAAKELSEKGLKTIVLERGRDVQHVKDYPTMNMDTWDLPNRGRVSAQEMKKYPVQSRTGYTIQEATKHWWPNDLENPYTEIKPFDWLRAYHVGGRSLLWGRQSYRFSEMDFSANAKDGHGVDWPIRYKDMSPWYDYVERFAGISGQNEGLHQLPDGQFLPPMEMNCLEKHVKQRVAKEFGGRMITIGRVANLTQAHNGRGGCQFRNRCSRGCPYGGYFSSNASTLPAAMKTGNLTIRPYSIVTEIIFDNGTQKAKGVRILDAETMETTEYYAKVIFNCASTIGSTSIMMNSKSIRFPDGLGNDSGELGHNLMDHHFKVGASGISDDFKDRYYEGRRPNGIYVPRFRNVDKASMRKDYVRGFGYQGGGSRTNWASEIKELGYGADFKADLFEPGPWRFGIGAWGEHLPYHDNKIIINPDLKDKYGLPTISIDCEFKENEWTMRKDAQTSAAEMLESAGLKDINTFNNTKNAPGNCIHEMGTARMGRDPKTSVLNKWNQVHAAKNVFVTDGSAMTSSACQNPSLTYMALTARAADYAVRALKRGGL